MEKKTFDIAGITSHDDLNALSIALNEKEQVSHMKIGKNNITFNCIDIEPLVKIIQSIDETLVVREVINGEKREYDFNQAIEKQYYFMFRNLDNEEDVLTLVNKMKKNDRYKDVTYDSANRMLFLTTSSRNIHKLIKRQMGLINPNVIVLEHHKPIRTQDAFQKKYLKNYMKIGFLLLTISLAIVTRKDSSSISPLFWIISILLLGENISVSAFNNLKDKKFLHEDILVILGMILGVISGHPIESTITMFLYLLFELFRIQLVERSFQKINNAVETPEKGLREKDGHDEMISLYDFEVNDILIVQSNEMIPIPGFIIDGNSDVSTYSNTGSYDHLTVGVGDKVHSGDINLRNPIKIRITRTYESGNLANMMNIASSAPLHQSRIEKLIKKFSDYLTPCIVLLAIISGIVLPIVNFEEYGNYMQIGAILLLVSGSFASEQSASIGMLAGFAKAFKSGIIIESAKGLDAINETQVIVYDTIDNSEMTGEEFYLLNKLSRLGRLLLVFNDTTKSFEDDQYKIYNHITTDEKIEIINNTIGNVVYIGDSSKDIECFQKSHVAISRGGISDPKVVANSDIVLVDSSFDRLVEVFSIASKMRFSSLINTLFSLLIKLLVIVLAVSSAIYIPIWMTIIYEAVAVSFVMFNATRILE